MPYVHEIIEVPDVADVIELFERCGASQYGGEAVTQLEHALQAGTLAELEGASMELIVAALLHDVGHLLHQLPNDSPAAGIDDHHENSASNFLRSLFSPNVTEPIRLHVAAKRYLCAVNEQYVRSLSEPSIVSLGLQGGPMTPAEAADFEKNPFAADTVRLRRWDDSAKIPGRATPTLRDFTTHLLQVIRKGQPT